MALISMSSNARCERIRSNRLSALVRAWRDVFWLHHLQILSYLCVLTVFFHHVKQVLKPLEVQQMRRDDATVLLRWRQTFTASKGSVWGFSLGFTLAASWKPWSYLTCNRARMWGAFLAGVIQMQQCLFKWFFYQEEWCSGESKSHRLRVMIEGFWDVFRHRTRC